jgi:hypothetical protein
MDNDYLVKEFKRQQNKRRCLHFNQGDECNEFISAHSIQRQGQLSLIQENGHVYRFSADLKVLKGHGGKPQPKKIGINKVSTFYGFCKAHDNQLFKYIDDFHLMPNKIQVALYAYRCLCREVYAKQNAVLSADQLVKMASLDAGMEMTSPFFEGFSSGLSWLQVHKKEYDTSISKRDLSKFYYICFRSKSRFDLQLSGVLYPEYSFSGDGLQNLLNDTLTPQLITFFTAPTDDGWAFTLAWHQSSDAICRQFVGSLAQRIHQGENVVDILTRFSFSCCENHAFRISWWDQLPEQKKSEICSRVYLMMNPFEPVPSDYLVFGCEGVSEWELETVQSEMNE